MEKNPKQKRKPLYRRTGPVKFKLQKRDTEIIRHVYKHRFLTSEHIIELIGGSRKGILRRLHNLFHTAYLDRPREQIRSYSYQLGSGPMVYGLGNKGADLLAREFNISRGKVDWTSKNREIKRSNIDHALEVSRFMVVLELACRYVKGVELIEQDDIISKLPEKYAKANRPGAWKIVSERNIAGRKRKLNFMVIPDKIFGLFFPEEPPGKNRLLFFLEADRSTMPVRRTSLYASSYFRKMTSYWESYQQGKFLEIFGLNARVLTVAKSGERIRNMIKANKDVDARGRGSAMFLFAQANDFTLNNPDKVFDEVWQNGRNDKLYSILN